MSKSVFLFVPNIIGYIRILLLGAAVAVWARQWRWFVAMYVVSQLLDGVDGWSARKLNQTSRFGAVLDQVTDRLSTVALLMILSCVYPNLCAWFIFAVILDIGGHWLHWSACTMAGKSHKDVPHSHSILRMYYSSRGCMTISIVCYEGLWLCLYARPHLEHLSTAWNVCVAFMIPPALFKMVIKSSEKLSLELWPRRSLICCTSG